MPTRNVVLTDSQTDLIDRLIADGRYQNASEALRAGLRLLEREEAEMTALRDRLAAAALAECRRTYSWNAVGRQIVGIYDGLAGTAPDIDFDPVLPMTPCRFRAAPHLLYGHVAPGRAYSVGDWLAEVAGLLEQNRPLVIAGGTGLYLTALTSGLAVIPPVPPQIRAEGDAWLARGGLSGMVEALDARTRAGLDLRNPARVQRAWEVLRATGRGLADWQAETPPPLVAPEAAQRIVLQMDRNRLARRIARRFDAMLDAGALEEVRQALPLWQPGAQWTRAIGAAELKDHLEGRATLAEARERAIIATRQYAKSQRIWFRNRMRGWPTLEV